MREHKSGLAGAVSLAGLIAAAVVVIMFSPSCSSEIDRDFGPSSLQGAGELPGRVITLSAPTGV